MRAERPNELPNNRLTDPLLPLLGGFMLLHVALLAALKFSRGLEGEMLWVSNAALAIAAIGLLLRSRDLVGAAFVSICALHALWLFDAVAGNTTGSFPLDATTYITLNDLPTLFATSHHLYLAPILAFAITRLGFSARHALPAAILLFAVLATTSRLVLPPTMNINLTHAVLPASGIDTLLAYQTLDTPLYLTIHISAASLLFFVPGALLASALNRRSAPSSANRTTSPNRPVEITEPTPAVQRITATKRSAFTLIELIAVLVILAVLSGVAIPRYINYTEQANDSADKGELGGIRTAMHAAYLQHRTENAPTGQWITSINNIAPVMETGELPRGIIVVGTRLQDRRGNQYDLVAETATTPARLTLVPSAGGGGSS